MNEEKLELLVDKINLESENYQEYLFSTDNIDDVLACIMESKHSINIDYLDYYNEEYTQNEIQSILNRISLGEIDLFLSSDITHGIHRVTNEVNSYNFGEQELQLSDELISELEKLNKDELEYISSKTEYYFEVSSKFIYIDLNYDRVSVVLDVDGLIEIFGPQKTNITDIIVAA